jgi:hypothetical protein
MILRAISFFQAKCHSDRSRTASDGTAEEPAVSLPSEIARAERTLLSGAFDFDLALRSHGRKGA